MLEDGLIRSTAYDLMNIIQVLSSSRMFTSKKVPILVTACSGVIATSRKPELAMDITSSLINTVVFTEPPQIIEFCNPGACAWRFYHRDIHAYALQKWVFLESETEAPDSNSSLLSMLAIAGMQGACHCIFPHAGRTLRSCCITKLVPAQSCAGFRCFGRNFRKLGIDMTWDGYTAQFTNSPAYI